MYTSALDSVEDKLKRLAYGGNDRSVAFRECTSCGTRFDVSNCSNCSSEIWRAKTIVPHASLALFSVLIATGVGVLRRIATGQLTSND